MNENDKAFARRMLHEKRLSIDQVERIKAEVNRGGRPFREVAIGRGLLPAAELPPPPPRKMDPLYLLLLGASALIFAVLLIMTVTRFRERSKHDEELAIETSKSMTEAEHQAAEARVGYQRSIIETREGRAKEALAKARAAMARSPQDLNEAFVGYNSYLDVLPDDIEVRIERAKTHELRRNYDLAITDLERAAALKPALAPALQDRVSQLRLLLARTPK